MVSKFRSQLFLCIWVAAYFGAAPGWAFEPPDLCEAAAAKAARATGVPIDVLRAVMIAETGRGLNGQVRPWPWTVNLNGKGVWFDDLAAAVSFVHSEHAKGARSYDIGCFQINYRWHGQHFRSSAQMFEAEANALYAARFLDKLYAETGDWAEAAGAYHSRTKVHSDRYKARFADTLATVQNQAAATEETADVWMPITEFATVDAPEADENKAPQVTRSQGTSYRFLSVDSAQR